MIRNVSLNIIVDSGNAAIVEGGSKALTDILRECIDLIETESDDGSGHISRLLRDKNGNKIGVFSMDIDDDGDYDDE